MSSEVRLFTEVPSVLSRELRVNNSILHVLLNSEHALEGGYKNYNYCDEFLKITFWFSIFDLNLDYNQSCGQRLPRLFVEMPSVVSHGILLWRSSSQMFDWILNMLQKMVTKLAVPWWLLKINSFGTFIWCIALVR